MVIHIHQLHIKIVCTFNTLIIPKLHHFLQFPKTELPFEFLHYLYMYIILLFVFRYVTHRNGAAVNKLYQIYIISKSVEETRSQLSTLHKFTYSVSRSLDNKLYTMKVKYFSGVLTTALNLILNQIENYARFNY